MPAPEESLKRTKLPLVSKALAYIVLLLFCFLSILSYWYFDQQKGVLVEHRVEQEIVSRLNQAGERLDRDTAIIRGLQGLFLASDVVDRDEFYEYLSALDLKKNYAGIYSIGYAARVAPSAVSSFTNLVRGDTSVLPSGYPEFAIYPTVPVDQKDDLYVVKYMYPEDTFRAAIGFNMASDASRSLAIQRTIATKKPTSTEKVMLATDKSEAVLLFLPVEKNNNVDGVVMVTMQLDNFFKNVTEGFSSDARFVFTVDEEDPETGVKKPLYASGPIPPSTAQSITKSEAVMFGERKWNVTFIAARDYGLTLFERLLPLFVAEFTAAIGILLFILLYQATRIKDRAVSLAEAMVADLKESEGRFHAITESAKDAIVMMDSQARIVLWNKAAEGMFGYSEQEVLGKPLHPLITTTKEHQKTERLTFFGQTGQSDVLGKAIELPVKKKDGTIFTIELTVARTKLHGQWHAVGIMRDVTERLKEQAKVVEQAKELERMNKIMVDRELKMIELKKQTQSPS